MQQVQIAAVDATRSHTAKFESFARFNAALLRTRAEIAEPDHRADSDERMAELQAREGRELQQIAVAELGNHRDALVRFRIARDLALEAAADGDWADARLAMMLTAAEQDIVRLLAALRNAETRLADCLVAQ